MNKAFIRKSCIILIAIQYFGLCIVYVSMAFPKRKRNQIKIIFEETFLHDLQLYSFPPKSVTTVDRIIDVCLQRLRVLQTIEKVNNTGKKLYSKEWKTTIVQEVKNDSSLKVYYNFLSPQKSFKIQNQTARFEDCTAHFTLLAFFARNPVHLKWFLMFELQLFHLRYASLSDPDIELFKIQNGFPYLPLPCEEMSILKQNLAADVENSSFEGMKFYKIPFAEVPELVQTRNVYICKGFAYVPEIKLVEYFSEILSSRMEYRAKVSCYYYTLQFFYIHLRTTHS